MPISHSSILISSVTVQYTRSNFLFFFSWLERPRHFMRLWTIKWVLFKCQGLKPSPLYFVMNTAMCKWQLTFRLPLEAANARTFWSRATPCAFYRLCEFLLQSVRSWTTPRPPILPPSSNWPPLATPPPLDQTWGVNAVMTHTSFSGPSFGLFKEWSP